MDKLTSNELFKIMDILEKKINRTTKTEDIPALWDMHFKVKKLWFATALEEHKSTLEA